MNTTKKYLRTAEPASIEIRVQGDTVRAVLDLDSHEIGQEEAWLANLAQITPDRLRAALIELCESGQA